jgi:hypothetical protein
MLENLLAKLPFSLNELLIALAIMIGFVLAGKI